MLTHERTDGRADSHNDVRSPFSNALFDFNET
jgi:hypothetical protein